MSTRDGKQSTGVWLAIALAAGVFFVIFTLRATDSSVLRFVIFAGEVLILSLALLVAVVVRNGRRRHQEDSGGESP